jgi:hypothetical protein
MMTFAQKSANIRSLENAMEHKDAKPCPEVDFVKK